MASDETDMTTIADDHGGHGPGGGDGDAHGHDHPKHLAHHFDTPQQQFDSGKLGIWLFLTTEILLFSGLFCAYSVYRSNHPDVFEYAHLWLNKKLGALNTIVLIFSSFTMAWGVRASQQGKKNLCVGLLGITIACGAAFMCVKYVEYTTKFREALYPGQYYNPTEGPSQIGNIEQTTQTPVVITETAPRVSTTQDAAPVQHDPTGAAFEGSKISRAAVGPTGLSSDWVNSERTRMDTGSPVTTGHEIGDEPRNVQIFFSIYFLMTGLHGIHVLAGMALIFWVLLRAQKGEFGPEYFTPVDFVGLYWHVVDLIWIFLFPLLYLIS